MSFIQPVTHVDRSVTLDIFGGPTITVTRDTYGLGFCRDARSGNIIATIVDESKHAASRNRRVEIVVLPRAFFRIVSHVDRHAIAGYTEVTESQLIALGFITGTEVSYDELAG